MANESTSGGFWSGLGDNVGSILEKAGGIVDTVKAVTGGGSNSANIQYDQYGRTPGQPGYGTATPPASGVVATGFFASLSLGVKIAIGAGVLVGGVILYKILRKKR